MWHWPLSPPPPSQACCHWTDWASLRIPFHFSSKSWHSLTVTSSFPECLKTSKSFVYTWSNPVLRGNNVRHSFGNPRDKWEKSLEKHLTHVIKLCYNNLLTDGKAAGWHIPHKDGISNHPTNILRKVNLFYTLIPFIGHGKCKQSLWDVLGIVLHYPDTLAEWTEYTLCHFWMKVIRNQCAFFYVFPSPAVDTKHPKWHS